MSEELREFCRLYDISLYVAQIVIPKALNNLWHIEKRDVNRMAFHCSHGILQDERVVPIRRKEVCYCTNWVYRGPIEQVLRLSADTQSRTEDITLS